MWDSVLSRVLVPYQDTTSAKFRYRQLKQKVRTKYDQVEPYFLNIPSSAYKTGYVDRYFIKKINESEINEISKKTFEDFGSSKIDPNLYIVVQLKWYITGELNTTTVNGITNKTVADKNAEEIFKASKTMPDISLKLQNLTEFYMNSEYIVPNDINKMV